MSTPTLRHPAFTRLLRFAIYTGISLCAATASAQSSSPASRRSAVSVTADRLAWSEAGPTGSQVDQPTLVPEAAAPIRPLGSKRQSPFSGAYDGLRAVDGYVIDEDAYNVNNEFDELETRHTTFRYDVYADDGQTSVRYDSTIITFEVRVEHNRCETGIESWSVSSEGHRIWQKQRFYGKWEGFSEAWKFVSREDFVDQQRITKETGFTLDSMGGVASHTRYDKINYERADTSVEVSLTIRDTVLADTSSMTVRQTVRNEAGDPLFLKYLYYFFDENGSRILDRETVYRSEYVYGNTGQIERMTRTTTSTPSDLPPAVDTYLYTYSDRADTVCLTSVDYRYSDVGDSLIADSSRRIWVYDYDLEQRIETHSTWKEYPLVDSNRLRVARYDYSDPYRYASERISYSGPDYRIPGYRTEYVLNYEESLPAPVTPQREATPCTAGGLIGRGRLGLQPGGDVSFRMFSMTGSSVWNSDDAVPLSEVSQVLPAGLYVLAGSNGCRTKLYLN